MSCKYSCSQQRAKSLALLSYDGHIFSWFNDQGKQVSLSSHLLLSLDFPQGNGRVEKKDGLPVQVDGLTDANESM